MALQEAVMNSQSDCKVRTLGMLLLNAKLRGPPKAFITKTPVKILVVGPVNDQGYSNIIKDKRN